MKKLQLRFTMQIGLSEGIKPMAKFEKFKVFFLLTQLQIFSNSIAPATGEGVLLGLKAFVVRVTEFIRPAGENI